MVGAFDSAIKGIKEEDFTDVYYLSGLLISVGGATKDNTLTLVGVSIATTGTTMFQLISLGMLDAEGIGSMLPKISKDTTDALRRLKKQFTTDEEINQEELISALGLLAKCYVKMNQKLTQLQQLAITQSAATESD
ncbi:MAG: hypothetical protein LN415_00905 [Candidatus Thermoplasmatota archaeon]|nr:hypothetical protein [Candidatus Thermoplasmatota archaeon]